MCRLWSAVSVTLRAGTDAVCELFSVLGDQLTNHRSVATAAIAALIQSTRGSVPLRCSGGMPSGDSFVMCVLGQFRAMPPSTAKRLKQSCRVGIATGLRLHEVDTRLLKGLLGA